MKFLPPQNLIDEGWIRIQEKDGLRLHSYSEKCQYERHWNEWTLQARGIVTDLEGNIVARPFRKFFNIEELEGVELQMPPWPPARVQEKMDGSLCICWFYNDEWRFCTRGSFVSEQALAAKEIGGERMRSTTFFSDMVAQDYTHLFEFVSPANRIVVDYGDKTDLIYLASIHTEEGFETRSTMMEKLFESPAIYTPADIKDLYKGKKENREGYVLTWDDGFKVKVKFEEYKRLHRLLSGMTERRVWEILKEDGAEGIRAIRGSLPEEWHRWLDLQVMKLQRKYRYIEEKSAEMYHRGCRLVKKEEGRKAWAQFVRESGYALPSILFMRYDGKDYSHVIWEHIKPEGNSIIKVEEE